LSPVPCFCNHSVNAGEYGLSFPAAGEAAGIFIFIASTNAAAAYNRHRSNRIFKGPMLPFLLWPQVA
jgi:hypothetical protein